MSIITIQFKRGSTAQNEAYTGAVGSLSVDLTKNNLRLHDGVTVGGHEILNAAQVASAISSATSTITVPVTSVAGRTGDVTLTAEDVSGVATLDTNGKIVTSQLPPLSITSVQVVADETAKAAIVTTGDNATVQEGDVVIVTNANSDPAISPKTYILDSTGAWVEITAGNEVLSVNGQTGVVQLGKSDVGLGNVENYGVATQEQAEDTLDPSNTVYMTPLRTLQMFNQLGITIDENGDGVIDLGVLEDESEDESESGE